MTSKIFALATVMLGFVAACAASPEELPNEGAAHQEQALTLTATATAAAFPAPTCTIATTGGACFRVCCSQPSAQERHCGAMPC
jgi:hypothetical protein